MTAMDHSALQAHPLRRLLARLGQEWPVLAASTVIAMLALSADIDRLAVIGLWAFLALVTLLRRPGRIVVERQVSMPLSVQPSPQASLRAVSAALGGLDAPVFVLNREEQILFQNSAAQQAFGGVPEGAHISARLRAPALLEKVGDTIATGRENRFELSERLPSERVYGVLVAPVEMPYGDGGRETVYILSFRDLSESRRIDRMRTDFVANASHELRTPLASLRGFIETMQGPAKNDEKARERFLAIMLEQATRMSRLVDDLLSLSRLELKAHQPPAQKVDLVPLIGHVRDALLPLAEELDVTIALHLPDGKAEVEGDRDELVQVFENLMENACKYGQEGKVVDVRLTGGGEVPVEVTVSDHGPGIAAEHVPRLTERFYRVNVEASRSKKGTGLGLAIVKHILTRHRARLVVRSQLGKGTEFTVRF